MKMNYIGKAREVGRYYGKKREEKKQRSAAL